MSPEFTDFIKTPKGKLVLSLCALLLSWVFLFWNLSGDLTNWIPNAKRMAEKQKQLKKLQKENAGIQDSLRRFLKLRDRYSQKKTSSWVLKRDGDPELLLPQRVAAAAKKAGLSLNNFGSVRNTRINNDFFYAELEVSANASFENVVNFVKEIEKLRPQISWRRFNVNVMMRRATTSTKTVNQAKKDTTIDTTMLIFSGSLRVIVYDGESEKLEVRPK